MYKKAKTQKKKDQTHKTIKSERWETIQGFLIPSF